MRRFFDGDLTINLSDYHVLKQSTFNLRARVWVYAANTGSWHFLTVPTEVSAEIKKKFGMRAIGWGSLKVNVTVGKTTWNTSLFFDRKRNAYLLPLKADVRKKEKIEKGSEIAVIIII